MKKSTLWHNLEQRVAADRGVYDKETVDNMCDLNNTLEAYATNLSLLANSHSIDEAQKSIDALAASGNNLGAALSKVQSKSVSEVGEKITPFTNPFAKATGLALRVALKKVKGDWTTEAVNKNNRNVTASCSLLRVFVERVNSQTTRKISRLIALCRSALQSNTGLDQKAKADLVEEVDKLSKLEGETSLKSPLASYEQYQKLQEKLVTYTDKAKETPQ